MVVIRECLEKRSRRRVQFISTYVSRLWCSTPHGARTNRNREVLLVASLPSGCNAEDMVGRSTGDIYGKGERL